MKIDLNEWDVISKPRLPERTTKAGCMRIALQRYPKADYLLFSITESAAIESHIAIWDRVSVAISKDREFVTLFKHTEGTHKLTCTKAKELQGECRRGYIKMTVRDKRILQTFGFDSETEPSELVKYKIGDGFITCYASRRTNRLLEAVFPDRKTQQGVAV
jgi:hypothetical protein